MSLYGRSVRAIWHFDPVTRFAQRWLRVFQKLGMIPAEMRQIERNVGEVMNNDGGGEFIRFREFARSISCEIKREHLDNNPLIKAMGSEWARGKVVLYFDKLIENEMTTECYRMGLAEWISRTQLDIDPGQCTLLIARKRWFSYLEAHARSQGIQLIAYRELWSIDRLAKACRWGIQAFGKAWAVLLKTILDQLRRPKASARSKNPPAKIALKKQSTGSTIALRYSHKKLSFDPTVRSEFFWLNESGIPHSEILVHDFVTDKPLDAKILDQIHTRGVRLLGRGPGIPVWTPTWRIMLILTRITLKLILGVVSCLARGRWVPWYYIHRLFLLGVHYSYWHDFYAVNRVRVSVGLQNTVVSQVLALDALNGATVAFQHSISYLSFHHPTSFISAGENVWFVSSFVFEKIWRSIKSPIDNFVHTGFINDNSCKRIGVTKRMSNMRQKFKENGARFIICFFDENSIDRWDIPGGNNEAPASYEYLLEWLLADPSLALVLKPKASLTLFDRINRVSDLIDQAEQTGRCRFLMSDAGWKNSIYPAEAASIADLCIGSLGGGTAAYEARLAGVPALLYDSIGLHNHPFYGWGRGRVVFEDWESLRTAIEKYRATPKAHPEFGDWSPCLNDLDPFRDGKASLRMGFYIRRVYEILKEGVSRQEALARAADDFAQRWGKSHVTLD